MTRAADDYPAIAERLRQIEAAKGHPLACRACRGTGWEQTPGSWYMGVYVAPTVTVCHVCGNPENLPAPEEP